MLDGIFAIFGPKHALRIPKIGKDFNLVLISGETRFLWCFVYFVLKNAYIFLRSEDNTSGAPPPSPNILDFEGGGAPLGPE